MVFTVPTANPAAPSAVACDNLISLHTRTHAHTHAHTHTHIDTPGNGANACVLEERGEGGGGGGGGRFNRRKWLWRLRRLRPHRHLASCTAAAAAAAAAPSPPPPATTSSTTTPHPGEQQRAADQLSRQLVLATENRVQVDGEEFEHEALDEAARSIPEVVGALEGDDIGVRKGAQNGCLGLHVSTGLEHGVAVEGPVQDLDGHLDLPTPSLQPFEVDALEDLGARTTLPEALATAPASPQCAFHVQRESARASLRGRESN